MLSPFRGGWSPEDSGRRGRNSTPFPRYARPSPASGGENSHYLKLATSTPMKTQNITLGFALLLLIAFIGFWPTYYGKLLGGENFTPYFHYHAVTAVLWIAMLITQPILIKQNKLALHRTIGKLSYALVPLLYLSIILLAHHRADPGNENMALELWLPFKDLIIFTFGYGVAIFYRKTMAIHYRGMMVAGFALIEPAMARVMMNVIGIEFPTGYLLGLLPIYLLLLFLTFRERKEAKGRCVFPIALGLFAFIHSVVILRWKVPGWEAFAEWFVGLGIT